MKFFMRYCDHSVLLDLSVNIRAPMQCSVHGMYGGFVAKRCIRH